MMICLVRLYANEWGVYADEWGGSKRLTVFVATSDRHEARKAAAAKMREWTGQQMSAREIPMRNVELRNMLPGSAILA